MPCAADNTLLKIPDDQTTFSDEKVHFLSDIYPTAWHGNELAQVGKDDIVAIWGAGPGAPYPNPIGV